jgi:nucleotide-binding universal stress UspA family protein
MDERRSWLVCFDTDRIKQYVLATNRLKEIRGASALLADLDQKRKKELIDRYGEDNLAYSAGGGAAVLVPTEQEAKELLAEIEREFRAETITASVTGVSPPLGAVNGERFGRRMAEASKYLRRAKAAKAELATLPTEPYLRLCSSCGQQPAAVRVSDGSGDWLCCSCDKKRKLGSEKRRGYFKEFLTWVDSDEWKKAEMADDLDGVGAIASPPNYVGFIALDGNRMGSLLDKPKTVKQYRQFSKGLDDLSKERTFAALKDYGSPRSDVAPFEIVLIGGDDVLLITAADIAIEVALAIAEGFESESPGKVLEPAGLTGECDKLTMAGGVVLAHADFPIPGMQQLAEALQKSAKKHLASEGYKTGAIDFLVVSGSETDLEMMREAIPHRRPYILKDLKRLLDYIHKFKRADFPMSQLQAMYQALFESKVNAQLASIATLGYLGRRVDREQYNRLKTFFADFGVEFDGQLPPWDRETEKREGRPVSALTDLVELYPFIRMKGEA